MVLPSNERKQAERACDLSLDRSQLSHEAPPGVGIEPLSRIAYFQRLGIDVWVRRALKPPAPERTASTRVRRETSRRLPKPLDHPPPAVGSGAAARPVVEVPPRFPVQEPAAEPDAPPAFRIRCFRYGRVFAAIGEDAWPRRRFLLGVALALNGFERAERQQIVFEWPQPGVDPHASGRSFRAFFRHQTRAGERALLSGARVPTLLGHETPTQTCLLNDTLYVAPQAPDAIAKKALWRLIQSRHGTDAKHA